MVRPHIRPGITVPRDLEKFIALLRKEPRVVLPRLDVERLHRYEQGEDGELRPKTQPLKSTVRHKVTDRILEEVREAIAEAAKIVEELEIRRVVGPQEPLKNDDPQIDKVLRKMKKLAWFPEQMRKELEEGRKQDLEMLRFCQELSEFEAKLAPMIKVVQRGERRLPESVKAKIGMDGSSVPDWAGLLEKCGLPVDQEGGHFIRATIECGKPGPDGLRSRTVELEIDDLAGLLEEYGRRIEFWLVTPVVGGVPRWVMPVAVSLTSATSTAPA
jgi:hypothetical protein